MIKKTIALALMVYGLTANAQVGINCQYMPAIQFGSVKVKVTDPKLGTYKYGAGLPLMMLDRIGAKWYWNMDMNALYYGATQANKAADNQIKIAKTEGGYFSSRVGRMFGKGDQNRFGACFSLGYSTSNLDSAKKTFEPRGYMNYGLGILYYQKMGKLRFVGKVGYEKYSAKFITKGKGSGIYIETTFAYMIYQKFGISLMPCIYSKKFNYTPELASGVSVAATDAKVSSTVFRLGITKFL